MNKFLFFAFCTVVALVAFFIVTPLWEKTKLKTKLASQFGQVPENRAGLVNARTFWQAYWEKETPAYYIDNTTWHDLEMNDIFTRINVCQSTVGDACLYTALHLPNTSDELLEKRQQLQNIFTQNPQLCLQAQFHLARLGRQVGGGLEIPAFFPELLNVPARRFYQLLAIAPFLSLLLLPISPILGGVLCAIFMFGNFGLFIGFKAKNDSGFYSVRTVASCVVAAQRLAALLQPHTPDFFAEMNSIVRKFAPFSRSNAILVFNDIMEKFWVDPFTFFLLPLLSYAKLTIWLKNNPQTVRRLYSLLGEADMAASFASVKETLAVTCQPNFTQNAEINFTNLCHPLLEEAIPNSASFTNDVLLTGSNASGKSTFVKAIAVNLLLAQTMGFCTASSFRLKRGIIASSMAVEDSSSDGDSYFIAEIKSMKRLLELTNGEEFCYFFIDEILKGTNTIERIAASAAVLQALHNTHCLCFTATHDIELTDILSELFDNYHFRETITATGIFFDYKLHLGPSTTRNAILLLERMNFPDCVPSHAQHLATDFEKNGTWQHLHKHRNK